MLLLGIVLFTFFQEAKTAGVQSVVAQEGVVRKTQFPRLVIPLSSVSDRLLQPLRQPDRRPRLPLRLRRRPAVDVVSLPGRGDRAVRSSPRGSSMALSVLLRPLPRRRDHLDRRRPGALLRNADPLPGERLHQSPTHDTKEHLLMLNPLSVIFEQVRVWVLAEPRSKAPTAAEAAGGALHLIPAGMIFVGVCAFAVWIFRREAPRVAENL